MTRALVPSCTCSSVKLWNGVVAAGYGNGQIRLYEAATGVLRAEVNAHARWIYALDLAPLTGKVRGKLPAAGTRPAVPSACGTHGPGAGQGLLSTSTLRCTPLVSRSPRPRCCSPSQLLSGAEDSFVHVWKLSRNPDTDDVEVSPEARTLGREPGAGVGPCELSLARWDRGSVLLGRTASRGVLLPLGGCGAERWEPSGPSPSCCVGAQRSSPWA